MVNKEFDNVQMDVTFTEATSHDDNIVSGENIAISLGKLAKWKTDFHKIVWSGSYNDLSNKPTIPTVNNGKLTIQKNGTTVGEFTANQSGNTTANIIVPTTPSDIGAAPESHTHTKSQITDFPASLKNPNSLTVQGNGTASFTYDGSSAKTLNIKPGTGISVSSDTSGNITITNSSTNTDTKVTQTNTTTAADYRVILSANANDTTETTTARKSTNFLANPSTGEFYAKGYRRIDISGNTVDINTYNLSSGSPMRMFFIEKTNGGAANITNIPVTGVPFLLDVELIRWASETDYITRQIYTNAANPANSYVRYCTSGTWGAWTTRVYTDTHYTSHLITGASATATANAAATNGNVYLNILDNTTVRNSHNIVGSGATTVTSDANGKITISSSNTDTKVTQNNSTADSSLRVLLSKSANDTNETDVSYKSNKITFNPSTGLLDIKGKVSVSDSSYGCLELYRSGSNYFAGIKFYNDTSDSSGTKQLLGSIAMGNDQDTGLWRYKSDNSTKYKILDTENTSFTRTLTSGTKIGSIKINGTSTDIYCETNADTKNTAGSTNTSSKIFLIGATSQAANPQTYSHDTAYVGTDGCLYSNSTKVSVEGHTHSYLPLAGGTMTGPIKYNSGSKTSTPIVITDGDANGSMMAIGGTGGLTILGAGESANALAALIETEDGFPIPASDSGQFSYTTEHLILSSDTHIYFFTNCNTVANRKAMVLTTGLNLYPDTTNTGNIGTSTYKWAGMYATTFHGALDGNASTATSAGKWTTGITLTIGSTGKSVDGSGNVSWTLAEIGAAASSHTHTKSQITDFPASLKNPSSLTVQGNGTTSFTYDGSAAKTLNIKPGTGISVSSDTSGNITITNTSTNTDTKVTQSKSTTANYRPILIGYTNSADSSALTTTVTNRSYVAEGIYVKPSDAEVFANVFTSQSSTRHTSLFTSGIKLVTDSTSGSAMGMKYYTSDEATLIGEIGMYTSTNATEIGYAYIGKSYSDKWLNITADNTDFSGSIYVPHRIINRGKACSTSGGSGAVGYYCIGQFKITGTYFDAPIEVEVSDRGKLSLTTFSIRFANENSTDPAVSSLRYRGNGLTAYICKSTTSTWQLWVQASGTYSAITIHSIKCSYMNKMTVSYPETYLSNDDFTTAIASGGSLATNTKATVGTEYRVGSASQWVTARVINGMSINGAANRVNYGSCSTAAGTAAKTVACTGYALQSGGEITVKFTVANTANNPTLNVNSTGAKAIYYRGAAIPASYLAANRTYTFRYNGSQYDLVGDVDATASALSTTGTTPVQNKVVTTALQNLSYVLYETNGVDTLTSISNIDTASYDYFTIFIYKLSYLTGVFVAKGTSNVCPIADGHYVSISCPSGASATVAITRLDGVDVTSSTTSLYIQRIIGHKCVTV